MPLKITPELVAFAKQISEKFSTLKPAVYVSDNDKYVVEIKEKIVDGHRVLSTPSRINHKTGVVQLNGVRFFNAAPSFIFTNIIWCETILQLKKESDKTINELHKDADKFVFDYVLANLGEWEAVIGSWVQILKSVPSLLNSERIKLLTEYILKAK